MFLQDVDEKLLYDTFSAFGVIVTNPKVMTPLSSFTLAHYAVLFIMQPLLVDPRLEGNDLCSSIIFIS